jgi:hypothetical protein
LLTVTSLALLMMFLCLAPPVRAQVIGDAGAAFVPGPDMVDVKLGHMAAVSPDGKMLVFGGRMQSDNSELWDPASNKFTYKSMNYFHAYGPALARLADGRYLIAGGADSSTMDSNTAEVYDFQKNSFTPTAGTMTSKHGHCGAGTLDDGRVLVVGGWSSADPGSVYGDLFNPDRGTFTATKALNSPRTMPLALPTADGKAVVLGGFPQDSSKGTPVELYDPASNGFTILQSELFPGEPDWVTYGYYYVLPRSIDTQRLSDGRYLLLAERNLPGQVEMTLFTFDPATKAITKFPVTPAWPAGVPLFAQVRQPLVDRRAEKAYLLLPLLSYGSSPQHYRLYTVDLRTGQRKNTSGYYNSPTWLEESSVAVLPDGRIFLTGGLTPQGEYNYAQKTTLFIYPPGIPRPNLAGLLDLLLN